MVIRNEVRKGANGEPEVWTNLADVLEWMGTLPEQSLSPAAAGAALEIRQALLEQFLEAPIQGR